MFRSRGGRVRSGTLRTASVDPSWSRGLGGYLRPPPSIAKPKPPTLAQVQAAHNALAAELKRLNDEVRRAHEAFKLANFTFTITIGGTSPPPDTLSNAGLSTCACVRCPSPAREAGRLTPDGPVCVACA